jgi:hypothetical protein
MKSENYFPTLWIAADSLLYVPETVLSFFIAAPQLSGLNILLTIPHSALLELPHLGIPAEVGCRERLSVR